MKNFNIESDKRKSFDNIIDFDIIVAQNIEFFDITSKIQSIKLNVLIDVKIVDEINNEVNDEVNEKVTNDFKNKINLLNEKKTIWLNVKIKAKTSIDVKIFENVNLNFFW